MSSSATSPTPSQDCKREAVTPRNHLELIALPIKIDPAADAACSLFLAPPDSVFHTLLTYLHCAAGPPLGLEPGNAPGALAFGSAGAALTAHFDQSDFKNRSDCD